MCGRSTGAILIYFCLILFVGLAACADSRWRDDPAVEAARTACGSQSGMDYDCVERQAVAHLNPDICRLVGKYIDDMCLQAVYEAAGDPAICDLIYLRGVVPNCRAYYAQRTPASALPTGTIEIPIQTQTPSPTFTPPPTTTLTGVPTAIATPTPLFVFDLTGYDPDLFQPIDVAHNPPLIARLDETVTLVFDLTNTIYCTELERYC